MTRRIRALSEGTLLFHGTAAEEELELRAEPFWVSDDIRVAQRFGDIPEPAKSRWKTTGRHPRVLTYRAAVDIPLLLWDADKDIEHFVYEETGEEDYAGIDMIDLANMVCDAGYDGWIIPGNYPEGADILLCDPVAALEFVETKRL